MADDGPADPEQKLDETVEETFPASDTPGNTVETGIRVDASDAVVQDNPDKARFELQVDGQVAVLQYERRAHAIVLVHTEVPLRLRRRGMGTALVKAALEAARAEGLRVIARCPFVKAYLQNHPELT